MVHAPLRLYEHVDASTADPGRRLLLLLGGADRFLGRARRALETGDGRTFTASMSRAHAIVGTLADALDDAAGGQIAANLGGLYLWSLRHLTLGLAHRSARHIDEVRVVLARIREGFEDAVPAARHGAGG